MQSITFWLPTATNVYRKKSPIVGTRFSAESSPTGPAAHDSVKFSGSNDEINAYLRDLRDDLVVASSQAEVSNIIASLRGRGDSRKTGKWERLAGIRKAFEDEATRLRIDFTLIQDKHGIGPRRGWDKQQEEEQQSQN